MILPKWYIPAGLVSVLLLMLLVLPLVGPAHHSVSAASGITLSSSVQTAYPNSMTFDVTAKSSSNITQLRLHYQVLHQNFANVVSEGWAQFSPSTSVSTSWFWDMRKAGLPPSTQVQYWWTAVDSGGNTGQTNATTVSFDDNRYKWQTITTDPVILEWYNGNSQFADSLMSAAQQGVQRIEGNVGAVPQGQVHIFIYGSQQDLLGSMLFPQPWEGGVTFEGYDTIAIGVATDQLDFGDRAVPHELTHWMVHQVTFNDYGAGLPVWLDEGLATYGESAGVNSVYQSALKSAISSNQLISVRSLSSPFSSIAQVAYTSYGESYSLVTFLMQKYGKNNMVQLLNAFHQGATYDDALKQVYGFDQDGLDTVWRQSLGINSN